MPDMKPSKLTADCHRLTAALVEATISGGVHLKTLVFPAQVETPYFTAVARVANLEQAVLANGVIAK